MDAGDRPGVRRNSVSPSSPTGTRTDLLTRIWSFGGSLRHRWTRCKAARRQLPRTGNFHLAQATRASTCDGGLSRRQASYGWSSPPPHPGAPAARLSRSPAYRPCRSTLSPLRRLPPDATTTDCGPCHGSALLAERRQPPAGTAFKYRARWPREHRARSHAAIGAGDTLRVCHADHHGGHPRGSSDPLCAAATCPIWWSSTTTWRAVVGIDQRRQRHRRRQRVCGACHATTSAHMAPHDGGLPSGDGCSECHESNTSAEHENDCAACHKSTDDRVIAAIAGSDVRVWLVSRARHPSTRLLQGQDGTTTSGPRRLDRGTGARCSASIGDNPDNPGAHANYLATTAKCGMCHSVHRAAGDGVKLLPTADATCAGCHTGGTAITAKTITWGASTRTGRRRWPPEWSCRWGGGPHNDGRDTLFEDGYWDGVSASASGAELRARRALRLLHPPLPRHQPARREHLEVHDLRCQAAVQQQPADRTTRSTTRARHRTAPTAETTLSMTTSAPPTRRSHASSTTTRARAREPDDNRRSAQQGCH